MKSQALQSATKLVGLFLKSHNKRTDEEIMAAFGADEDEDDEEAFEVFKDVSGVPKSKDKVGRMWAVDLTSQVQT